MTTSHYSVAVVGAGPIGMTVAALLGHYGVDCVLLEKNAQICQHPRAQTIDDESLRTLQTLNLAEPFLATTREAEGSHYYNANGECFAKVGPGPRNFGYAKRNYMLQQKLDAILYAYLLQNEKVTVRLSSKVTDLAQDGSVVKLTVNDDEIITADYVLACDGGQSPIRNALGIELDGWTYRQDWIVLDALNDPDTEGVSRFFCNPSRPGVSIASPENGRRYEFMVMPGETVEQVLTDAFLTDLLKPYRPFDSDCITRRAVYTFHARIANSLRNDRVLLLGDAAHMTPPFAGQGMNAGVRDAHNVAWKIACVVNNGASASILDSYDDERRTPIWEMIQLAVAMGDFVMPVSAEQVSLTESMMVALERFPKVQDWLFQMKFKPQPRYDQGLFVNLSNQPLSASLVGEMLPQPPVTLANGQPGLLDDALGAGFSLIAQDDAGDRAVAKSQHSLWHQLQPHRIRLLPHEHEASPGACDVIRVKDSPWLKPLRTHRDQILLVRPDRYVAGACEADAIDELATTMAAQLGL